MLRREEKIRLERKDFLSAGIPSFISSKLDLELPQNTIFLSSYETRGAQINLYKFTDRPEILYFILPLWYSLDEKETQILERARLKLSGFTPDTDFSRKNFTDFAKNAIQEAADELGGAESIDLLVEIFVKYTAGFGIIEEILSDERIQDIYVNAPVEKNPLHVILDGEECITNVYLSKEDIDALLTRLRTISGRAFSEASPVLDTGLDEYHTRVAVIGSPLSKDGIAYAFRRHRKEPWTLPMLLSKGMLFPFQAGLLSFLVDSQSSILIAGDVGSGKTSLLTALLLELPQKYRILTIEDTPEIPIQSLQKLGWKVQSLSTHSPVMEGEISPEKALRAALRLGNSALVIGEVRGPEVKTLYEAMQIGTAGNSVLGTIHGASPEAVYERIVDTLGVPKSSFRITDAVVTCSRIREGGGTGRKRIVSRICEVLKDGSQIFLEMDETSLCKSRLLKRIADRWRMSVDEMVQNIKIRTAMKERILEGRKKNPRLLEAEEVTEANNMFWLLVDRSKEEYGKPDYPDVYRKWSEWYKKKDD